MKNLVEKTGLSLLLVVVLVAASTIFLVEGSPSNEIVGKTKSAPAVPSAGVITTSVDPGTCGPIDVAIVLDNTGSMFGAIDNIKAELPTIISTANTASGGDLRVGYITFGQTDTNEPIIVQNNLTTNISAVMDSINATIAMDGADAPEPSDEAKNTAINNLPAGSRLDVLSFSGTQVGDFSTPWRAGAKKIAVLITDAPPNGFSENATFSARSAGDSAYNLNMNTTLPAQALAKGILFSDVFVNDSGDYASMPPFTGVGQKELLMADANGTGGAFIEVAGNGSGTGAAIASIISACGGAPPAGKPGKVVGFGRIGPKANPEKEFEIFASTTFIPKGKVEVTDYANGKTIKSTDISSVLTNNVSTPKTGTIKGNATVNGAGPYPFIVDVVDASNPSHGLDVFQMSIPAIGYMNKGNVSIGDITVVK